MTNKASKHPYLTLVAFSFEFHPLSVGKLLFKLNNSYQRRFGLVCSELILEFLLREVFIFSVRVLRMIARKEKLLGCALDFFFSQYALHSFSVCLVLRCIYTNYSFDCINIVLV